MKVDQPLADMSATAEASSHANRRQRAIPAAVALALMCSGTTSCTRTQVALSATAVGVVLVGTTVGVTYAVEHHLHTLEGCVFSDASGLKIRTSDAKVYELRGDAASVKTGEKVKLHGSKVKKAKGSSTGDQVFEIQKLNKVYGPCSANVEASLTATR